MWEMLKQKNKSCGDLRSEPQRPVETTWTCTWPWEGSHILRSVIRISRGPWRTAAVEWAMIVVAGDIVVGCALEQLDLTPFYNKIWQRKTSRDFELYNGATQVNGPTPPLSDLPRVLQIGLSAPDPNSPLGLTPSRSPTFKLFILLN